MLRGRRKERGERRRGEYWGEELHEWKVGVLVFVGYF